MQKQGGDVGAEAGRAEMARADANARQYRKKPVVIEAVRWTGDNVAAVTAFLNGAGFFSFSGIHIRTLEGVMVAKEGDWIIRGIKGELYPCKPDIFAATYDPVADNPEGA